jgi:hypothetical protein
MHRKEILEAAIQGLEHQRQQIGEQLKELLAELTPQVENLKKRRGRPPIETVHTNGIKAKKRKFSAATREKMRLSQIKRWKEAKKKVA